MRSNRLIRLLVEIVQTVAITALAIILLHQFIVRPYKIEQTSMEQSFEPGEYVLTDVITPRVTGFHRGDVVIFSPPAGWPQGGKNEGGPIPLIKRVIGLPGETITLSAGIVSVDGVPLDESYIFRDGASAPDLEDGSEVVEGTWTLGPDELLVMGDHRSNSADSRANGPIPISAVIGRAVLRYFPIDRMTLIAPPPYGVQSP